MIYDLIVVGGGPAGLSAAYQAFQEGVKKILILERDKELGGILNQCIHNGFGIHIFQEELTGPEYAERYIELIKKTNIEVLLETMVIDIDAGQKIKKVIAVGKKIGYQELRARSIILAMGSRERTRFMIQIPGTRPAGIFTAGTDQRYLNIEGYMIGRKVVILGSGDIGLIMARRLTLLGAKVLCVVEIMPYSSGLSRNIVQCLEDYNIPLKLSHTVTKISGNNRLESVTIAKVNERGQPVSGTEQVIECDTLLLSVGLVPENEISKRAGVKLDARTGGPYVNDAMETNKEGIFACGNVLHIHDIVDFVSNEGAKAGKSAAEYLRDQSSSSKLNIVVENGNAVKYTVPQYIRTPVSSDSEQEILFRVNNVYKNVKIVVKDKDQNVIKSLRRAFVAPGEMERIKLKNADLLKAKGKITVALEEV